MNGAAVGRRGLYWRAEGSGLKQLVNSDQEGNDLMTVITLLSSSQNDFRAASWEGRRKEWQLHPQYWGWNWGTYSQSIKIPEYSLEFHSLSRLCWTKETSMLEENVCELLLNLTPSSLNWLELPSSLRGLYYWLFERNKVSGHTWELIFPCMCLKLNLLSFWRWC